MNEQISEEFAKNELLKFRPIIAKKIHDVLYSSNRIKDKWGKIKKLLLEEWKEGKYIKQSREDEVMERLTDLYIIYEEKYRNNFPKDIEDYITTMTNIKNFSKKLIEILFDQIKELKNK